MKRPRQQTFQESGVTIQPYTSLPTKSVKCKVHDYELRVDGFDNKFYQCRNCSELK